MRPLSCAEICVHVSQPGQRGSLGVTGSRVPAHVPPLPRLAQTRSAPARLEKQPPGAHGVMDVPDVPPHTAPCGKKPLVR